MSRADAAEIARLRAEIERERQVHEVALREHDEHRRALLALLEDLEESHRKIEQAQREWNAAFDAVLDPIFLHDKDFRVVRANRAYAARAGQPFQEIIGRPYWEIFPKGAGPLATCRHAMERTADNEVEGEEEVRLETGEVFLSRNFPVRGADGAWLFGVHIFQDVTEKYRAERALRESEDKFHRITAAAQDAILMMDNDGRVAFWNAAAERIFGYSAQEALGQQLHLFLAPERYYTDYRKGFVHFRDTGEGPVIGKILELVARRKDGTEFPIELSVSALKLKDRWQAVGILRDVTKRKRAETELRLFRTLLDNSSDAVEVIDPVTLRFLDVNEKECRELGYSREELLSMTVPDIDPAFGPASMKMIDEQVHKSGAALFEGFHRRKDGSTFPVEISLKFVEIGEKTYVLSIARDITARKQAEEALRESEKKYRTLFEESFDGIFVTSPGGKILDINRKGVEIFGYDTKEEMQRLDLTKDVYANPTDRQRILTMVNAQGSAEYDVEVRKKNGEKIVAHCSLTAVKDKGGAIASYRGIIRDVTEQRRAAEALAASERLRRLLLDTLTQKVFYKDRNSVYIACNAAYARDLRIVPDAIVDKTDYEFFPAELADRYRADDRDVMDSGLTKNIEEPYLQDGKEFWVHTVKSPMRDAAGNVTGVLGIFWDVTEQHRAAASLKRSEENLAEAQRIAHLGSWELDLVANKLTWSDEIYRIFEIDPKQFGASYETFLDAIHPDDREAVDRAYTGHVKQGVPYDIVHRLLSKDGRVKYVHERCETTYDDGRPLRSLGTVQDVTERKLAEITLAKVMRALQILSGSNEALIHATDETSLLREVCHIIVEVGGYRMAMVAFAEQDEAKTLRPVAHAGFESGYADTVKLSWSADSERGRGPGGVAVRTGQPCMARDIPTDQAFAPWRDEAMRRGYRSIIALPLTSAGRTFGALGIYSSEPDAFDAEEVKILGELADDLAYGIVNLRLRKEQVLGAARLRESLVDTIRAIALTVEKRDPYTAGHQNNVAKLCVAIGREMGMDESRLEGMGLAATIHDIGKIYIPAEILNRPGKLTDPEFEIIKSHPQVGYDIVKDVKFPWPVGEMILQHHERLDGSGYPKGLKGEDIILEARILAVADVIEAMASHRPYRPAHGLDAALAEIEKHRGTWYDTAVVDACIKIIREGRFQLDAT